MIRAVSIYVLLAVLVACVPKRTTPKLKPAVYRPTYSYWEDGPDRYTVYLPQSTSEKDARNELCSSKTYACVVEPAGRIVKIERVRK